MLGFGRVLYGWQRTLDCGRSKSLGLLTVLKGMVSLGSQQPETQPDVRQFNRRTPSEEVAKASLICDPSERRYYFWRICLQRFSFLYVSLL